MTATIQAIKGNPSFKAQAASASTVLDETAVADEIRIVQSVQTQNNMPVLIFGNSAAAAIVAYIDWAVLIDSNAVYFLAALILLLVPVFRSYLKLRNMPRPTRVSKRRVRIIVIHSFLLGLAWAGALYLMISQLDPINGVLILYLMFFVGFGATALMPSLPLAAIAYLIPISLAANLAAVTNDVLSVDLLLVIAIGGYGSILRSIWQSWIDAKLSVRISLEKLAAEGESHRRETEAVRSMLAAVPFPIVLTRETGALEASETAARQFGIPEGGVGGLQIVDFFVDPEEQQRMADLQAEQGRLDECEVQLRNAEGQPFWALLSSLPLKHEGEDCWLNAIVVIDDRKRAEAELMHAHETLERVSEQLAKYISPQLYQAIFSGKQNVAIESKRKKLTVFFSDIANFTEITDQLESEELTGLLNEYLTEMSIIAQKYGAYFDKFIGDAMMFYFGDPETKASKKMRSPALEWLWKCNDGCAICKPAGVRTD